MSRITQININDSVYDIGIEQVQVDWNSSSGYSQILNKPTLGEAASYDVQTSAPVSEEDKLITSGAVYAVLGDINTVLESVL